MEESDIFPATSSLLRIDLSASMTLLTYRPSQPEIESQLDQAVNRREVVCGLRKDFSHSEKNISILIR